jgi:MFS family permease
MSLARPEPSAATPDRAVDKRFRVGGRYAWYVLGLTVLVSAFSLIDRQILTIVAGDLKAHLGLSNAEVGLLYGTVFAIFYAVFGIPLGRLADSWNRSRLLALGVGGWSLMTVLSGLSSSFAMLAATRAGVAIGEAVSNPAANSLLADWFPKHRRATVLAMYACGVSIGMGASLAIGGQVLDAWTRAFPSGSGAFGLHAWQVALLVVGAPGFLLAAWLATLREPPRGLSEGVVERPSAHPFRRAGAELAAILPLTSLVRLKQLKARPMDYVVNLAVLAIVATAVVLLTRFTTSLAPPQKVLTLFRLGGLAFSAHAVQWATLGLGAAVTFTWVQSLRLGDRPTYRLLWATPTVVALTAASALFMTLNYGLMAWTALYMITHFHAPAGEVGLFFGGIGAVVGVVGTLLGGWLADAGLKVSPRARLWVSLFAMVTPWPLVHWVYASHSLGEFYLRFPILSLCTTMWLPGVVTTCQDLVLPRMRGAAGATYNLSVTMVGLGLGPFLVGLISDRTGNLATGVLSIYWLSPAVWACMAVALVTLPKAQATRLDRARAAGEPI